MGWGIAVDFSARKKNRFVTVTGRGVDHRDNPPSRCPPCVFLFVRLRTKQEKLAQLLASVKDIDGVSGS